ncbi:MarR family winged helix-turn-helix transcriptional regulator [Palleronia sp. LCG004]|uniref:MarR family winged helix-turn-helix transcriptional regulator n=1 Tax=Palleronia sp. LCG004 TaxID=3079304 RepID=UPI002943C582|nr:MarR family winged helix-turn-helix transcriptional regulator [Palleronia sp. LCG004]WOI57723.1 MarR family winged helix-turn-helix transcriptional regulator [Palleronia sp. LCG004]
MADFDLGTFVPYLLNQAAEETGQGFARIYKARYGMLRTEWRVLFHLGRYGDMSASEVGRLSKTHKTKISRAVAALGRKRFVAKRESAEDRRREILTLLPLGRRAFEDLVVVAERQNMAMLESLSQAEREILIKCLRKLAGFGPTG